MTALTIQHIEEAISRAHVRAIAGRAGFAIATPDFDYKMDGTFRTPAIYAGKRGFSGSSVDFQLKACKNMETQGDKMAYDLEAATFNFMIERNKDSGAPMILIACSLHDDEENWVVATESVLSLKNCCYWAYLTEDAVDLTDNTATKRIFFDRRKHFFGPHALKEIMDAAVGGTLADIYG